MAGSQSFKYIGSFIDFNRLGQLRIANTTTVAILKRDLTSLKRKMEQTGSVEDCQHNNSGNFKKRLNVIKAQNGRHIADLV